MKVNKKLAVAGLTAAVGVSSLAGIGVVSAHYGAGDSDIAAKIAEKFNLSEDEVQTVFDEEKEAMQAEKAAERSEKLQELVDSGDITAEQKTLLEEKQSELQVQQESNREALDAWADENSIDTKYIMMSGRGDTDKLADAVEDGDITEAQKTLIEAKQEELQAARESQKEALEQWAIDNDISEDYLKLGGGRGKGGPRN